MSQYVYKITNLLRTVDGDTVDLTVEKTMVFGFYLEDRKHWSTRFRLLGVDTYERNEAGGSAATAFTDAWIKDAILADVLVGETFKADSFGRWLIDLWRIDTGEHLKDALIEGGHGVVYSK